MKSINYTEDGNSMQYKFEKIEFLVTKGLSETMLHRYIYIYILYNCCVCCRFILVFLLLLITDLKPDCWCVAGLIFRIGVRVCVALLISKGTTHVMMKVWLDMTIPCVNYVYSKCDVHYFPE